MPETPPARGSAEVWTAFVRLGLTSFGGPIAHLGYFRAELVTRRRWLGEAHYAQLLSLAQLLPGPASSQAGFALGLLRAGWAGAIAAFVAFTLPSAILLIAFAELADHMAGGTGQAVLHGLKLTAVCVVAHALIGMARQLTPDLKRALIAAAVAALVLLAGNPWVQLLAIALGALLGAALCRTGNGVAELTISIPYGQRTAVLSLGAFAVLLAASIGLAGAESSMTAVVAGFYRAGALVFGGGHVVLPLLEQTVVRPGWLTAEEFLAGYGAAQAVPGPMFSVAGYLGMRIGGPVMAAACLIAIFLPGFLLVVGVLPFWTAMVRLAAARSMLAGINAAVVGILAAALYDPVWTAGIDDTLDFVLAAAGLAMLLSRRVPVPAVVAWCVVAAVARGAFGV